MLYFYVFMMNMKKKSIFYVVSLLFKDSVEMANEWTMDSGLEGNK